MVRDTAGSWKSSRPIEVEEPKFQESSDTVKPKTQCNSRAAANTRQKRTPSCGGCSCFRKGASRDGVALVKPIPYCLGRLDLDRAGAPPRPKCPTCLWRRGSRARRESLLVPTMSNVSPFVPRVRESKTQFTFFSIGGQTNRRRAREGQTWTE
jgi:hypothetical protein